MLPADLPLANKQLERSLLGALMVLSAAGDDDETKKALGIVRAKDFFTDDHKLVFRVILALSKRGLHFSMEAVYTILERQGKVNGSLTRADLRAMQNEIILPPAPAEQALQVRALGDYRDAVQAALDLRAFVETTTSAAQIRARVKELSAGLERTAYLSTSPTQSLRSLLATEFPPTVPVIDPLIMAGDSMLIVGNSKTGKSVFALQVALAVASGGDALDGLPVEETRDVLFLNLDDRPSRIKARAEVMLASFPDGVYPHCLEFAHRWPALDQGGEGMLHTWAEQHPGGVIVIDLLEKIRPARGGNIYQADYAAVGAITDVAHTNGVTTLTVHHATKAGLNPNVVFNADFSVSGSEAIRGAADGHIVFHPVDTNLPGRRVITVRSRDTAGDQYQLEWDEFVHGWRWEGIDISKQVRDKGAIGPQRQAIRDTIQEAGHSLSPVEIATRLNKPRPAVRMLLGAMVKANQITWYPDLGRYDHPSEVARRGDQHP